MDITTVQSLIQLARQSTGPVGERAFVEQVDRAWGRLIDRQLVQFARQTAVRSLNLRQVVLVELSHLIRQLPVAHSAYVANQADRVVAELVEAAHWKLSVRAEPIDHVATWGKSRQADILRWMDAVDRQPGTTYLKQLLVYLDANDRLAVAHRVLRVLVYSVIRAENPIFGLYNGQVGIQEEIGRGYFFDQVALYVYLYKNKEEALFLKDALLKVRAYARQKLLQQNVVEPDVLAKDIMGKVQLDFVSQYDKQRTAPFFLDVKLTTYLISFVNRHPAFKGPGREQPFPDGYEPPADDPPDGETPWQNVLNYCKRQLGERCQSLLDMHYDNQRSQPLSLSDMAIELNRRAKQVEGELQRCREKLRQFVVAECERHQLIFYPR